MRRLFSGAVLSALIALISTAHAGPPTPLGPVHPAVVTFGENATVELAPHSDTVRRLSNLSIPTTGATPAERATRFLDAHRKALGLGHVRYQAAETTPLPRASGHVVRFGLTAVTSTFENLEIQDMSVAIRLDREGRVRSVTSDALPFTLTAPPTITADDAIAATRARYQLATTGTPRLLVTVPAAHHATLVWRVPVALIPLQAHFFVWVDATTGAVLRDTPAGFDQRVTRLPLRPASSLEVPR